MRAATRGAKGAVSWVVDQAIEHWPALVLLLGGTVMTYLASISSWMATYGPVAWGAVGIASICMLSAAYSLYGFARGRIGLADFARAKATTSPSNVLAPTHSNERLQLSDFFHPFYHATENVRFENCEILGPGLLAMVGCTLTSPTLRECEVVIVREDRGVRGASMFKFCNLNRCKLYRITFIMNYATYQSFPPEFRTGVTVISDGTIGDV